MQVPKVFSHSPPEVRHRLRGELQADLPGCRVEVFSHRHVDLGEWSLVDASASYWRLYWATTGSAVVIYEGREYALKTNDAGLLIPPHTNFSSRCDRSFSKWYLHFTCGGFGNLARPGVYPIDRSKRLQSILKRTCPTTGITRGTLPPDVWRPLWAVELITCAVQQAIPELCMTREVSPHAERVMRVVREQATSGVTLTVLARTIGLSAREVSRIVKDVTGFTPARYLLQVRLDAALNLLKHTDESIEYVAKQTGFPNRHYLTRMLAKHRQTTPAVFRKRLSP